MSRPDGPTPGALRELHAAHLERVPFENLDIPLGRPISLELDDLFDKIVVRRRGGFCYELNGLLASALASLGYEVTMFGASAAVGERFTLPLDHAVVRVRCSDGSEWLADVGFGDFCRLPLRWEIGVDQDDPDGTFRLETDSTGDVYVFKDGSCEYRVEAHPRERHDFAGMCWYHQTSMDSHFTRGVVCSRWTPDGRVTLSGDRLIRTVAGERVERRLGSDAEILAAYRDEFGIELDEVPRAGQNA